MEFSKIIKRLTEILLIFSLFSFSVSPITNLLGVQPPQQITNITDFIKLLSMFIAATLIVAVLVMFVIGYFVLTGWRSYKTIPKILRLFLAFALGYASFMFSGLISTFVQMPILPTIISTIILWAALRSISGFIVSGEKRIKMDGSVHIERAIDAVISFLKKIEPNVEKSDIIEVKRTDDVWEITMLSKTGRRYRIKVDDSSGGIIAWVRE